MPIRQAFEPELIREMSLAVENVCETSRLTLHDDANTRLVASKIIELAQRWCAGCADPNRNGAQRVQALLIAFGNGTS
jgi:hypothetical protein